MLYGLYNEGVSNRRLALAGPGATQFGFVRIIGCLILVSRCQFGACNNQTQGGKRWRSAGKLPIFCACHDGTHKPKNFHRGKSLTVTGRVRQVTRMHFLRILIIAGSLPVGAPDLVPNWILRYPAVRSALSVTLRRLGFLRPHLKSACSARIVVSPG